MESLEAIDWLHNQSMGRPSKRRERRAQILGAFAIVLADHGYAGATIAAIAAEADIAPGLIHHHFKNKQELLDALLTQLLAAFRQRTQSIQSDAPVLDYGNGALKLDESADLVAARCWVGLFAEAVRDPALHRRMQALLSGEVEDLRHRSGGQLSEQQASALLSFVVGSLVVGAFAPHRTAGSAAGSFERLAGALLSHSEQTTGS